MVFANSKVKNYVLLITDRFTSCERAIPVIDAMLIMIQCWASVVDDGLTLKRYWVNVLCLLGCRDCYPFVAKCELFFDRILQYTMSYKTLLCVTCRSGTLGLFRLLDIMSAYNIVKIRLKCT